MLSHSFVYVFSFHFLKCVSTSDEGILLRLHIQPRASKSEVAGTHGDCLKIRLKAPPVEGKANSELIKFLSKLLGLPKNNIEIISGHASRRKTVKLAGITKEKLIKILLTPSLYKGRGC